MNLMNPNMRLGLLAFGIVFTFAAVVLIIAVVASRPSPESPPTTAPLLPPPRPQPPPPTAAPPVFSCRKLFETADSLERYRGQRVVVVGPVAKLDTTSFTARISWKVPEGLGCAYLNDDPQQDQPQTICVFQGGRPASLRVGAPCRIEGTYRGPLAVSGVPLLIECQLATEPAPFNPGPARTKNRG
jgi:hypothetical protein